MNSLILTLLALAAWVFTLLRLRAIDWDEVRKGQDNDLTIFALVFFCSLGLTFEITEVAAFLDAHVSPNLSMLISQCSFLAGDYFLIAASLAAIGAPTGRRTIRIIRILLGLALSALLVIYLLYLSKMPSSPQFLAAQSIPELIFKLIVWFFAIMLFMILARTYLVYLPAEKLAVLRWRALAIILCVTSAAAHLLVSSIIILAGYFQPALSLPWLPPLATLFAICAVLAFLAALLSSPLYARFSEFMLVRERWHTFQDLQYLAERMAQLFPAVVLPPPHPAPWQFVFDPEYYLYRAVVFILDSQSMLYKLMKEIDNDPPPTDEEDIEMQAEVREIHRVLRSLNPSGDLFEVVEVYRRASLELAAQHKGTQVTVT